MNIFVLDADHDRVLVFARLFLKNDVKNQVAFATHVNLALECLSKEKYDLIFLDYDLAGKFSGTKDKHNTGYYAAKGLLKTINADTDVIVHSLDSAGAEKIMKVLAKRSKGKTKCIPFGLSLIRTFLKNSRTGKSLW